MKDLEESQGIDAPWLPILETLPVLFRYAKTRGWYYVISWLDKFTGYQALHRPDGPYLHRPVMANGRYFPYRYDNPGLADLCFPCLGHVFDCVLSCPERRSPHSV